MPSLLLLHFIPEPACDSCTYLLEPAHVPNAKPCVASATDLFVPDIRTMPPFLKSMLAPGTSKSDRTPLTDVCVNKATLPCLI